MIEDFIEESRQFRCALSNKLMQFPHKGTDGKHYDLSSHSTVSSLLAPNTKVDKELLEATSLYIKRSLTALVEELDRDATSASTHSEFICELFEHSSHELSKRISRLEDHKIDIVAIQLVEKLPTVIEILKNVNYKADLYILKHFLLKTADWQRDNTGKMLRFVEKAIMSFAVSDPRPVIEIVETAMRVYPSHINSALLIRMNLIVLDAYAKPKCNRLRAFNGALIRKEAYLKLVSRLEVLVFSCLASRNRVVSLGLEGGSATWVDLAFTAAYDQVKLADSSTDRKIQDVNERLFHAYNSIENDLQLAIQDSDEAFQAQHLNHLGLANEMEGIVSSFFPQPARRIKPPLYLYYQGSTNIIRLRAGKKIIQLNHANAWLKCCAYADNKLVVIKNCPRNIHPGVDTICLIDLKRDYSAIALPCSKKSYDKKGSCFASAPGYVYAFNIKASGFEKYQAERYSMNSGIWEDISPLPIVLPISSVNVIDSLHALYAIGCPRDSRTRVVELCLITNSWRVLNVVLPNYAITQSLTCLEFPDYLYVVQGNWLHLLDPQSESYQKHSRFDQNFQFDNLRVACFSEGVLYN